MVQAQTSGGGVANVAANTDVSLSLATGTGTLGGTLTGTINAGSSSVTISGVTYTKAESGVSVTATRTSGDSLTPGTSALFTVNPGAAAQLAITAINSGVTPAEGTPFNVTLQSQDAQGNPANVTANTGVTISAIGNGSGSANGTIPTGNNTISVPVTYTSLGLFPEAGIVVTAHRTSGNALADATTTISVNPPVCTTWSFVAEPGSVVAGEVTTAFTVQTDSPYGPPCSVVDPT